MRGRLFRLVAGLLLLAAVAACTTAPVARPAAPRAAPALSSDNVSTGPAAAPAVVPAREPQDEVATRPEAPIPGLLDGQNPREFQRGHASWYGPRFHGRRTASGERYDMNAFTAAHRSLPFGTLVRVRSLVNGHEVEVRITDRGPYVGDRIIDLSRAAAEELGMLGLGFKQVVLYVPESLPELVPVAPVPAKKRVRPQRRPAPPKR